MSGVLGILVIVLLLWVSVRTLSFAVWNWKHNNRTGSVMVALVSLAAVILPVYIAFFKT